MGNRDTHDRLVRELATRVGAAVVFPQYDASPEAKFPVPVEQSYSVMEYVCKHADQFGIAADGVIVAGDSAGGNMATVLCMLAKLRHGPNIVFQLLLYPVTDAGLDTGSYHQFADGPWLTLKAMQWFWDAYLKPETDRGDPLVSPLRASKEELAGLPPALIITAENDVLRDEGEEYAKKLELAGVKTGCVRVDGTIHDFLMLDALAGSEPAKTGLRLAVAETKDAFRATFPASR